MINALNNAVSGLLFQSNKIAENAQKIAQAPVTNTDKPPVSDAKVAPPDILSVNDVDLTTATISNLEAAQAYKVNAQVISTVKELGEVLLNTLDKKA
jgi:hypothetical protein